MAKSGNTGHSFAPHLHYQLQTSGGAIMDPFAGKTHRASLPAEARTAFLAEADRLDGLLDHAAAAPPTAQQPSQQQ